VTVLVSDTSVLVDLERGALLEACFGLEHDFAVPDLLYRRELEPFNGPQLLAMGLQVIELTKDEVIAAQAVRTERIKLSLPDAFAYTLASTRDWELLSGDGEMRALAQANNVQYHGVLWVCDRIHDAQIIEGDVLATSLEAIAGHVRCRLPKAAIAACLGRYRHQA
jgi:hypothetical protein